MKRETYTLQFLDSIEYSVKLLNVQEEQKPIITSQNASYIAHFNTLDFFRKNPESRALHGADSEDFVILQLASF